MFRISSLLAYRSLSSCGTNGVGDSARVRGVVVRERENGTVR